jgi:hypothetical protein
MQHENPGAAAPPARLRAPIKWALAGTLLVTAAELLWPNHEVVPAQQRGDVTLPPSPRAASAAMSLEPVPVQAAAPAASTPASIGIRAQTVVASAATSFDPFIGVVPPPQPMPPSVAQPVAVAPPPAPPAQDYRFLGRVTGPDGSEQILVTRGEVPVAVNVGTTLENGYVVESISADGLQLVYPRLGNKALIPFGPDRSGL